MDTDDTDIPESVDPSPSDAPDGDVPEARNITCLRIGAMPPSQGLDEARRQMRAAHRYYNTLVEIERNRRAAVREAEARYGLFDAQEKLRLAEEAVEAVLVRVNEAKVASRSRQVPKELRAEFKAAKDAATTAKREFTAVRSRLKAEAVAANAPVAAAIDALKALKARAKGGARQKDAALRAELEAAEAALEAARRRLSETETLAGEMERIRTMAGELSRAARAQSGVHWGTYMQVEAATEAAFKVPVWSAGKPNDPGFRRWEGEGSLGLHFQPPAEMADVLAGTHTQLRITDAEMPPAVAARIERKRARMAAEGNTTWQPRAGRDVQDMRTLWFRAGTTERTDGGGGGRGEPLWLKVPVLLSRHAVRTGVSGHRLPQNAIVRGASLHLRKIGPREQWSVTLTLELPRGESLTPDRCGTGAVAVHLGWRRVDGELRVGVVLGDDGRREEVVLTQRMEDALTKPRSIQSIRDRHAEVIRPLIVGALRERAKLPAGAEGALPERLAADVKTMHAWRSIDRLRGFVRRWQREYGGVGGDVPCAGENAGTPEAFRQMTPESARGRLPQGKTVFDAAVAWAYRDHHLWEYETSTRATALNDREQHYQNIAARLARTYGVLVLDDTDRAQIAQRPKGPPPPVDETTNGPAGGAAAPIERVAPAPQMEDFAASNRVLAAVSVLETALVNAFRARGGRIVEVKADGETQTCARCGTIVPADYSVRVVECPSCGSRHDQDDNAARNQLAAARDPARVTKGVPVAATPAKKA